MNALKTGLLTILASGALFGAGAGIARADTSTGLPSNPPAMRSSIGSTGNIGEYCADLSGGEIFVPTGVELPGAYCSPATPPAHTAPALPSTWPDAGPNTGSGE